MKKITTRHPERMRRIFLTVIFSLWTVWIFADDKINTEFRSKEWQKEQGKEETGYVSFLMEKPGDTLVLRVGSPIYNRFRNIIRNEMDTKGHSTNAFANLILKLEEIDGVGPNTLVVFKRDRGISTIYEAHNHEKELSGWKVYLYDQGKGWVEIVLEDGGIYTVIMPLNSVIILPTYEIYNALTSNSIGNRYKNSGLAIWDETKGIGYAVIDIPMELVEGDIARSLKALIRVPLMGVQLGGTLASKTVRLPVDFVMSAVFGFRSIFFDNTQLSRDERVALIMDNNKYDVSLTFGNIQVEGEANFGHPYALAKESNYIQLDGKRILMEWTVFDNKDPFLTGFFGAIVTYQKKQLLFLGKIDGMHDIDIKGDIIQLQEPVTLESESILNYFKKYDSAIGYSVIGTFHFDD